MITLVLVLDRIFRFPINFKSEVEETSLLSGRKFFYHVVLGIAYKGGQRDEELPFRSVYLVFRAFGHVTVTVNVIG